MYPNKFALISMWLFTGLVIVCQYKRNYLPDEDDSYPPSPREPAAAFLRIPRGCDDDTVGLAPSKKSAGKLNQPK